MDAKWLVGSRGGKQAGRLAGWQAQKAYRPVAALSAGWIPYTTFAPSLEAWKPQESMPGGCWQAQKAAPLKVRAGSPILPLLQAWNPQESMLGGFDRQRQAQKACRPVAALRFGLDPLKEDCRHRCLEA